MGSVMPSIVGAAPAARIRPESAGRGRSAPPGLRSRAHGARPRLAAVLHLESAHEHAGGPGPGRRCPSGQPTPRQSSPGRSACSASRSPTTSRRCRSCGSRARSSSSTAARAPHGLPHPARPRRRHVPLGGDPGQRPRRHARAARPGRPGRAPGQAGVLDPAGLAHARRPADPAGGRRRAARSHRVPQAPRSRTRACSTRDRKQPLPFLPRTVGLVCGRASAAEKDVVENARRRWPTVRFAIREVAVQGPHCRAEVTAALQELDADPGVDVIVISRGGGSRRGPPALQQRDAAPGGRGRAHPGRQRDRPRRRHPLLDLVADCRASTPTDAGKGSCPTPSPSARVDGAAARRASRAGSTASGGASCDPHPPGAGRPRPPWCGPARSRRGPARRVRTAGRGEAAPRRDHVAHLRAQIRTLSPLSTLDRGYAIVQHADGSGRDGPRRARGRRAPARAGRGGDFGVPRVGGAVGWRPCPRRPETARHHGDEGPGRRRRRPIREPPATSSSASSPSSRAVRSGLEESMRLWRRGEALAAHCSTWLDGAEATDSPESGQDSPRSCAADCDPPSGAGAGPPGSGHPALATGQARWAGPARSAKAASSSNVPVP